jgi:hypothetical protein
LRLPRLLRLLALELLLLRLLALELLLLPWLRLRLLLELELEPLE